MKNLSAKELRIGNWIRHKYSEPDFIVSVINTFNEDTVNGIELSDCEPIPLTEELLLKSGFKRSNEKLFYLPIPQIKSEMHFEKHTYGNVITLQSNLGIFISDDINYFHELQNLYFALTGSELELKTKYL